MIIVETVSHEYHIPSAVVSIASTMQTFPFSWKVLVPRLAINQNIQSIYITPERSLGYRFWLRGGLDVFPQHIAALGSPVPPVDPAAVLKYADFPLKEGGKQRIVLRCP